MAYTRAQFRDLIRQRLGWSTSDTFVEDAELNNYVNDSLAELHSLLTTIYATGQWGLATTTMTVTAGSTAGTPLITTGFGRLLRVDWAYAQTAYPVQAGNLQVDVRDNQSRSWTPGSQRYYLLHEGNLGVGILFYPAPTSNETITIYYVKPAPTLTADGDTSWMDWDEYVVLDCVCKCLRKEEADVSAAEAAKNAFAARIRTQAEPLDLGQAVTVADMRSVESMGSYGPEYNWWRR